MASKQDDVFNISVTEILLIIMFSLLVVMVLLNSTLSEEVEKSRENSDEYVKLVNELEKVNKQLGLSEEEVSTEQLDLNEAVAQMRSLVEALKLSIESDEAGEVLAKMKLNDVWTTLSRVKKDNLDVPGLIQALAKLNKELKECLSINDKLTAELDSQKNKLDNFDAMKKALDDAQDQLKKISEDNKNLTGQVENLSNGLEFPPCWATEEGKAQYTYKVAIFDDSLHVSSIYPSSRKISYLSLMKDEFIDEKLSIRDFRRKFSIFYTTSVNSVPECRFFVQVSDETSSNSKSEWKEGLKTVESIFYKYLVQ